MSKVEFKATTKNGFKLTGYDLASWIKNICRLFPNLDLTITIQKRRKIRSNQQNRWYWGVCIPKVMEGFLNTGHIVNKEDAHEFLKRKFLDGQEIASELTGEVVTITRSTSTLTTSQAMDFYARIQQFGSEFLGVYIPDPEEQVKMEFE